MTIAAPNIHEPALMPERLTLEQYHRMIETGILEEGSPIELLNGCLIRKDRSAAGEDPIAVGNEHILVVMRLTNISRLLEKHGCHLRAQQPIAIEPCDEPEPDGAIVNGTVEDYAGRKPAPGDVLAVIEVADASLRRDRTKKLSIYAQAGIPVYFIFNLREKVVEIHTQPLASSGRYGRAETLSPKQILLLPTARKALVKIPVRQLLP